MALKVKAKEKLQKIGQNSNADDVAWLRKEGYQVIQLQGHRHKKRSETDSEISVPDMV